MSKPIHIKKFAGGAMTPQEYHAKHAFPPTAKCAACNSRPQIRAIIMMELAEARKNPAVDQLLLAAPEEVLKNIVQIKGSDGKAQPYFRVSIVYSCMSCRRALEKQLAKVPSHCIVEINAGPDERNRVTV